MLLTYRKDQVSNADEVLALCKEAIDIERNAMAMMLMGFVFEHTMHELKFAKKWYLGALRNGSPWGLRYYALMQYGRKRYVSGVLCELVATIINPFLLMRHGARGPFK